MARNAIESEFPTYKMADQSEMVRNAIQSDFQTSKMAAGKEKKICIDMKWPELRSKVNFGHPKWSTSAIFSKISKKKKVAYRSEMARNAIKNFKKKKKKSVLI